MYTCAPSCEQQNNIAHCVKRHLIGISQKQRTVLSALVNIYLTCKCFHFVFGFYLKKKKLAAATIWITQTIYEWVSFALCWRANCIEFLHGIHVARKYFTQKKLDSIHSTLTGWPNLCAFIHVLFFTHFSSSPEFHRLTKSNTCFLHFHRTNVNTLKHTHISNNGTKTTYAYRKWKGQQMGHDERQRPKIIGKLNRIFGREHRELHCLHLLRCQ